MKNDLKMDDIYNLDISEIPGKDFHCSCGRVHSAGIKNIYIGGNVKEELVKALAVFKKNKILFLTDANTLKVCGKDILDCLIENNFTAKSFTFEGRQPLIPDESAVGRLLLEAGKDFSLIVTAGSGTLNDLSRYICFILNIPYMIICTSPSMDGYASTVSPLIIGGFKKTIEAVSPYAIFADEKVILEAPRDMIRAGFGDMVGKLTALSDWRLSKEINNEYYCENCSILMKKTAESCISDSREGFRDEKSVNNLLKSLILSGITMAFIGNSRPASGSEHHLAHYWEMSAISERRAHPLHGASVGAGTVAISMAYEILKSRVGMFASPPGPDYISGILEKAGAASSPAALGIDEKLFRASLLHAKELRPRYTILSYMADSGILEETAEIITKRFYS